MAYRIISSCRPCAHGCLEHARPPLQHIAHTFDNISNNTYITARRLSVFTGTSSALRAHRLAAAARKLPGPPSTDGRRGPLPPTTPGRRRRGRRISAPTSGVAEQPSDTTAAHHRAAPAREYVRPTISA